MYENVYSNQQDLNTILEALQELDVFEYDIEIRTDYSGRGMYGKECIGFVIKEAALLPMALTAVLIDADRYATLDNGVLWTDLSNVQMDSMGLSTIVYFPNWQLDTDYDDE